MLTTFFDGEIISKKYPFLTRKWDADEDVDRKHWVCMTFGNQILFFFVRVIEWLFQYETLSMFVTWLQLCFVFFFYLQSKFSAFKNKYEKTFNSDNFDYDSLAKSDYVFMRWKEHFLVSTKFIIDNQPILLFLSPTTFRYKIQMTQFKKKTTTTIWFRYLITRSKI